MSEGPAFSEPLLPGRGDSDYERYLRTDELLALQKGPAEWVHRDELLFQTVHQSSELWLKLASVELEEATRLIEAQDPDAALRLLRRALGCVGLVTEALDMLEHLSPWEYREVRKVLGHGSGFDSPGFRRLSAATPPLGLAFEALLARGGLTLGRLYVEPAGREQLYQLAELLIEWDERMVLWRVRHFLVVERVIGGSAIGTQGTPVEVLGGLIHKRFFPALWSLRNELTARPLAQQ
jgi:tryptophan 2,3-dioxygenase